MSIKLNFRLVWHERNALISATYRFLVSLQLRLVGIVVFRAISLSNTDRKKKRGNLRNEVEMIQAKPIVSWNYPGASCVSALKISLRENFKIKIYSGKSASTACSSSLLTSPLDMHFVMLKRKTLMQCTKEKREQKLHNGLFLKLTNWSVKIIGKWCSILVFCRYPPPQIDWTEHLPADDQKFVKMDS